METYMKPTFRLAAGLMAALTLAGCVSRPTGPTAAVMPGPGKSFDAFQADDAACRSYADRTIGNADESANERQIGTAVLGTVLGAGLGAAVGGGSGAAIGAGAGAIGGTAVGGANAGGAQHSLQQRYNIAYEQCMATKGNRLPEPAHVTYYYPSYYAPYSYMPGPAVVIVPAKPAPAPVPAATVTPGPAPAPASQAAAPQQTTKSQ
jgi:uncharacterized protein YcfJ